MSKIKLPNVTLVCVDTANIKNAVNAVQNCMEHVQFGSVKFFSLFPEGDTDVGEVECYSIPEIKSIEDYSHFIFFKLYRYIETDFVMICQHDWFIVNPKAWDPNFLKYDYIGAPWWYEDNHNVGNGGFSIRSRRLMEYMQNDETLIDWRGYHPEDDRICRQYRPELEAAGFRFAPEHLAARFSWEGNGKYPKYNGSFGFHGDIRNVKINGHTH